MKAAASGSSLGLQSHSESDFVLPFLALTQHQANRLAMGGPLRHRLLQRVNRMQKIVRIDIMTFE